MLRIATALLIASTSALRIGNQLSSQSAAAVEAELHSGSQAQAASGSQTTSGTSGYYGGYGGTLGFGTMGGYSGNNVYSGNSGNGNWDLSAFGSLAY